MKISPGDLFRIIHDGGTFIVLGGSKSRYALQTEHYLVWTCLDNTGAVRERAIEIGMSKDFQPLYEAL